MTRAPGGNLGKRIAVAAVGIPLAVSAVYLGRYWLAAFLAVPAALAAAEFCRMYRDKGVHAAPWASALLAAAYVALSVLLTAGSFTLWAVTLTLGAAAGLMLLTEPERGPGLSVVITVFGAAYTGGLLAHAVMLRELAGPARSWSAATVVLLPVAITWIGDTAAMLGGRALGRHKFAPVTSPNKTWEGAIAGALATAASAVVFVDLTRPLVGWSLTRWQVLGFGLLVALAGQTGDLFESRFKRDCGVKDSSNLLPGHGGMLDRLDSLLFVIPVSYAYLRLAGI